MICRCCSNKIQKYDKLVIVIDKDKKNEKIANLILNHIPLSDSTFNNNYGGFEKLSFKASFFTLPIT
jgi:hypothetical protein